MKTAISLLFLAGVAPCALAQQFPPGTKIATSLFNGSPLEPSGLDYIPGKDLLVGASDEGSIFFVKRSNPDEWWYFPKVQGVKNNWEGLTVDTGDSSDHLYIVHEGLSEDCAQLTKLEYTLGTPNVPTSSDNTVTLVSSFCLQALNGKLTSADGVESLTLYKPSSGNQPAEFLMGVQKTGILYSIDANGSLTGVVLQDGARDRVSGSQYFPDSDVLLVVGDNGDRMEAIFVGNSCSLKTWTTRGTNEEGLVVAGPDLYIADDAGNLYIHPNFDMSLIPNCCGGQCTPNPIANPSLAPAAPTNNPTAGPTVAPVAAPTPAPVAPTNNPTFGPTVAPVADPTPAPVTPTNNPTAPAFDCGTITSFKSCKSDSRCNWSGRRNSGTCVNN